MRGKHIIFDRDVHFTGGKETQIFHQIFNDYGYDSGRKSRDFDIENNELQIAQLEFNQHNKDTDDWINLNDEQRYDICLTLARCIETFLSQWGN